MTSVFKWDWLVRLTHWLVAALFLANYFALEEGSELHEWAGYTILAAIAVRLLWGIVCDSPARLSRFWPSPKAAVDHIKHALLERNDNHQGHNPAAAVMIWLLWLMIILTASSGWLMESDLFWGEEWLEEVHEVLANVTFILVTIHVSAVIVMSKLNRRDYIKSMLP
ncbi:cytochrome b [Vibrio galatheae]|uniref:Cytochrome b n=1 Tax=Vibrio galatheae TaxID=579748 RepID=A0A0F4NIL0_9VIBR|nr:cytochrome b/b6 domain-containing protein [Vibrio galatheae]KJY82942.1 cytochrome b [Vibrio galatheae]